MSRLRMYIRGQYFRLKRRLVERRFEPLLAAARADRRGDHRVLQVDYAIALDAIDDQIFKSKAHRIA